MGAFKSENGFIYADAPFMEFYVPTYYFDNKWAIPRGEQLRVFGIFNVGLYEGDKLKEIKSLNLPMFILINTYEQDIRNIDFKGSPNTKCMVYKYHKGQQIMQDSIIVDSDNALTYLDIIMKGKLPTTIPYSKALNMWEKNQELNNVNFSVPSTTLEMILAVSYRDKDHVEKKFATVIGADPSVSDYDYEMLNIRQICQYASTYTAMTFEDINSMITTSINRDRDKRDEMESPVERVMKF